MEERTLDFFGHFPLVIFSVLYFSAPESYFRPVVSSLSQVAQEGHFGVLRENTFEYCSYGHMWDSNTSKGYADVIAGRQT